MKIQYTLPCGRDRGACLVQPTPQPESRAPRIARLLALAHKLDQLVRSGAVRGYGELARLGHISPARLSQILRLLHLSPAIQEQVLFLPAAQARFIAERDLRAIASEPSWKRQREQFDKLLPPSSPASE